MTTPPTYDVLQSHVRPSPGKDIVGNEYEEDIQIVVGTEIQGGCYIGRRTWLNNVVVYANARIGRYCSFARGASIAAPSHPVEGVSTAVIFPDVSASMSFVATEIGHDVWIGTNATVLAGVKVGHGAVIGANAVVTKDVRPYAIVVGSPAKEMRRRFSDDVCDALIDSRWWDLPHEVLSAMPMANVRETLRLIHDLRAGSEATEENERLGRWLAKQPLAADAIAERTQDLANQLAEANERTEAAKAVIGALSASVRGLNRQAFQERVRQLGRDTPSEGPQAARHAVLLAQARRVLGIED